VRRVERQLLSLNDELGRLRRELELVEGELNLHRHLADDAVRDALVSELPLDRVDARETKRDVARLEASLASVQRRLGALEAKRTRLLARMDD
jgi:chromosome segregation ATPase